VKHPYTEGYFERAELSNYHGYGDDPGWELTARILAKYVPMGTRLYEYGAAKGFFVCQAPAAVESRIVVHDSTPPLPWDEPGGVVCSWEFLEHVDPDQVDDVLSGMLDLTEAGGLLVHRIDVIDGKHDPYSDKTHVSIHEPQWWREKFTGLLQCAPADVVEDELNAAFAGRDWEGRFFAYWV
jgi:hypothetical protein